MVVYFNITSNLSPQLVTWDSNPGLFVTMVALLVLQFTYGNFMMVAMILFEKYGMDPKKRTAVNQIVTACCYTVILGYFMPSPLLAWRFLVGPVGKLK